MLADLVLDSTGAGQLVAVSDRDYNGGFEEKRIPSLRRKKKTNSQLIKILNQIGRQKQ